MPEEEFDIFLSLLSQLLRLDPLQKSAIADELRDHLESRLGDLHEQGVPRKEAVRKALEEFGDAAGLASQFTSLSHHHRRRRILMRCTLATGVLAGLVFLAVSLFGPANPDGPPNQQAQAQQPAVPEKKLTSDFPVLMPEVLFKEVDVEFMDTPLSDVLDFLSNAAKLPAFIDKKALEEEGVALDQRINLVASKTPLYLILKRMLKPLGLSWYSKNDLLFVTTIIAAEEKLFTEYYPVKPLLDLGYTEIHIVDLVQIMTRGPWENLDGTGGRVQFMGQTLMVRQTFEVHMEITHLLTGLKKTDQPILRLEPKEHTQLREALSVPTDVEFIKTPLKRAADFLSDAHNVPIVLDKSALEEEGIALDEPVSLTLRGKSLETTLEMLLRSLEAEAVLEDGTILITTQIVSEDKLTTVIYNVKDIADTASAMDQLTEAIHTVTKGLWVIRDGTGGLIDPSKPGTMVIRQQERVHQEIETLLEYQRKSGDEVKLQPQPSEPYTQIYRMNADTAEDLLTALPEFVAPDTWQTEKTKGLGTIRKVAAGQRFVPFPTGTTPEKKPWHPKPKPEEKPPAETEPEPQFIVVPQAVLIIRQTPKVHREIDQFLDRFLPHEERYGTAHFRAN